MVYNINLGRLEVRRKTHKVYKSNLGGEKLGGKTLCVTAQNL
jgi:hypothetical protein